MPLCCQNQAYIGALAKVISFIVKPVTLSILCTLLHHFTHFETTVWWVFTEISLPEAGETFDNATQPFQYPKPCLHVTIRIHCNPDCIELCLHVKSPQNRYNSCIMQTCCKYCFHLFWTTDGEHICCTVYTVVFAHLNIFWEASKMNPGQLTLRCGFESGLVCHVNGAQTIESHRTHTLCMLKHCQYPAPVAIL